jgi:hypothetical protein
MGATAGGALLTVVGGVVPFVNSCFAFSSLIVSPHRCCVAFITMAPPLRARAFDGVEDLCDFSGIGPACRQENFAGWVRGDLARKSRDERFAHCSAIVTAIGGARAIFGH